MLCPISWLITMKIWNQNLQGWKPVAFQLDTYKRLLPRPFLASLIFPALSWGKCLQMGPSPKCRARLGHYLLYISFSSETSSSSCGLAITITLFVDHTKVWLLDLRGYTPCEIIMECGICGVSAQTFWLVWNVVSRSKLTCNSELLTHKEHEIEKYTIMAIMG